MVKKGRRVEMASIFFLLFYSTAKKDTAECVHDM
jgi:hypothetical protein